jgi:hypothetical protein
MATSVKDSWKAVAIVAGNSACPAALQLSGKRFLSRNAPRLPLPECTRQDQCQCKYRHLSDRRGAQRRTGEENRIGPNQPFAKEQRRPGERRERRR